MENDSESLRALSGYGYGIRLSFMQNMSQDGILFSLGYHTNLYKASNQIWQMLTHRPTPASFLHVATYDLFMDDQYKWLHEKRVLGVPYQN